MKLLGAKAGLEYFSKSFLALLYPPHCFGCERPIENGHYVCEDCFAQIEKVSPPFCQLCCTPLASEDIDLCENCAHRKRHFDLARSFGFYQDEEGVLERMIKALKYKGEKALAKELARYLAQAVADRREKFEKITFVPQTRRKQRERGFNHAQLIAEQLGRLLKKETIEALVKIKDTRPQVELRGEERLQNLKNAFLANKSQCDNILLIDDVFTTGTTVDECSRALKRAGYKRVFVLTVARTKAKHKEEADAARD